MSASTISPASIKNGVSATTIQVTQGEYSEIKATRITLVTAVNELSDACDFIAKVKAGIPGKPGDWIVEAFLADFPDRLRRGTADHQSTVNRLIARSLKSWANKPVPTEVVFDPQVTADELKRTMAMLQVGINKIFDAGDPDEITAIASLGLGEPVNGLVNNDGPLRFEVDANGVPMLDQAAADLIAADQRKLRTKIAELKMRRKQSKPVPAEPHVIVPAQPRHGRNGWGVKHDLTPEQLAASEAALANKKGPAIGKPNHQKSTPSPHGVVVAGAKKKNKKK